MVAVFFRVVFMISIEGRVENPWGIYSVVDKYFSSLVMVGFFNGK